MDYLVKGVTYMNISEICIVKFRSIKKCQIHFSKINALVGENNSGKTAILRAINCLFNYQFEEEQFINHAHQYAPRNNTKIEVVLTNIPEKHIYKDKVIDKKLTLGLKFRYSDNKRTLYCNTPQGIETLDEEFIRLLKEDLEYLYIPANRSSKDITWTDNSIFQRLLNSYSIQYTQNRDNISARVKNVADKFRDTVLPNIERQISKLDMLQTGAAYTVEYSDKLDYSIFLNKLNVFVDDSGKKYPVVECGSGIKSLTTIALHRAFGQIQNTNIVLGIEEPETNLHPQAQKKLISSLKNGMEANEVQAIISTHSTVIVDALNHEDIILVRRSPDDTRGFFSCVNQLDVSFWDKYGLETLKHYNFFRYRNSDFFFAKYVVLVESTTDAQVFQKILSQRLGEDLLYVSILNLNGVANIKYPYYLLKELGIPFSMIVDKDFFTPYLYDKLEDSRSPETGLPLYQDHLDEANDVLNDIFNEDQKRILLQVFKQSYKATFDFLHEFGIYTMIYCLEMDLCCSSKACEQYYQMLNMLPADHNLKSLLSDKKNAIKKPEYILPILDNIENKDYPISYKKIGKAIFEKIQCFI